MLSQMPPTGVLLFEDETILRLFPHWRRAWSLSGKQATIGVTGHNRKVVLFGAINVRTGHRIVMRDARMSQVGFQNFLHLLRRCYPGRQIWLLLDKGSCHTVPKSQALAESLDVKLIWLPRQCPELNAMDQFWRQVKSDISANYQFSSIEEHASFAEQYIIKLTNMQAKRRAGILSKNFWLKNYL
jgi:DDE superfamily endonuclease